ncbi:MAG: AMP-binding protein, partial [Silicimonas sp.]|nr:AMP-binding protein [Silicimonas sp.]
PDDICALKRTSGSTGASKLVTTNHMTEVDRALKGAAINRIEFGDRYAAATSIEAGMGRGTTFRALLTGATLFPLDLKHEAASEAATRLSRSGITHFHGTPTSLRLLASGMKPGQQIDSLKLIHLGGERTTPRDLDLVRKMAPPGCTLRSVYSSTETGVVAYSSFVAGEINPDAPIKMDIPNSVRVKIVDDDDLDVGTGATGRIRVTSSSVSLGYRGVLSQDLESRHTSDATGHMSFLTDDIGHLTTDGQLVLERRVGREVQINGVRVDLRQIEDWFLAQPDTRDAVALTHDNKIVVALTGSRQGDLRARMQNELPGAMLPAHILFFDDLPRTLSLKVDRNAIINSIRNRQDETKNTIRPDGIQRQVADAWSATCGQAPTAPQSRFDELGGDSIAAISLALMLEARTGKHVEPEFAWRHPSFQEQCTALESRASEPRNSDRLIVPLFPAEGGDGRTVFVVSGGGGHVFPFLPVAEKIAPDWSMVGLLHPKFRPEEKQSNALDDLTDRFLSSVMRYQSTGPYLFFGYSIGGTYAHMLCAKLNELGEQAGFVAVDTIVRALLPTRTRARGYARAMKADLAGFMRRQETGHFSAYHAKERLYSPKELSSPMVLIRAEQSVTRHRSTDFGWSRIASVQDVITLPGSHLDLFKGERCERFSAETTKALHKISRELNSSH